MMKSVKRKSVICLILLLALLLCACGNKADVSQPPPDPSPELTEAAAPETTSENPDLSPEPAQSAEPEETQAPTPSSSPSPSPTPSPTPEPPPSPTPAPTPEPTHNTQYNTDIVPEGRPEPVEPQDVTTGSAVYTCTLSVRCDTILSNMDKLDPEKLELVPESGVILAAKTVSFNEGESVFNVLQRELKAAGIHMEFRNTPIYNSAYIMGIGNLYEFDTGELSGWMYKVNGWFPNYGCSRYQLQQGDIIEWVYTCDLGSDVGGGSVVGG